MIHGDKHNNHLDEYPLINQKNKTINVSSEVVNYIPINLDKIISMIESGLDYRKI
jgi:calcineurin-like phosphoesterase family protein